MTRPPLRKVVRITAASLVALAILIGLAVAYRRSTGNLGTVEAGRVYRSAQLSPEALREVIARRGVKTVLNLRGPNPSEAWYRDEVAATLDAGAAQIDVPLASDMWLSHQEAQTLLGVLDDCEYPILIHCEFGAERTGLVSAMVKLLQPSGTLADARAQFSLRYLFLPTADGLVMRGHLDRYEAWLRAADLDHSPARFRRWLLAEYQPPWPNSREHWPCNPYPRKVVTTRDASGRRISLPEMPEDACPKTVATQIEADHARK